MRNRKTFLSLLTSLAFLAAPLGSATAATPDCTVTVSDSNTIYNGTNSSDVICITGNNVTVNALGGDDTVIDNGDNNIINLGDGYDYYIGLAGDSATADGGSGNDVIEGTPGADELSGGAGDDTIVGGAGNDKLDGGDGSDNLEGDAGNDNIFGQAGTDVLSGGLGDDLVAGGDGIDSVDGGDGLNTCDYTTGEAITQTCRYDDQAPTATVEFTPSTIDLTVDHPTISIHITATDVTGIDIVTWHCPKIWGALQPQYRAMGLGSYADQPSVTSQNWGNSTATSIDYTATISATKNEWPSGTGSCTVGTQDILGNRGSGTPTSMTIVSGWDALFGSDKTAPTVSFTLDQTTVDVTYSDVKVGFDYTAHDDLVGIQQSEATCQKRDANGIETDRFSIGSGGSYGYGGGNIKPVDRVMTDDTLNSHVTGWFLIPKDTIPGTYVCFSFTLDKAQNSAFIKDIGSLTVTDSTPQAELTPTIDSATISTRLVDTGSTGADVRIAYSTSAPRPIVHTVFNCTRYLNGQVDNNDFSYFYAEVTSEYFGGSHFQIQSNNPAVTFTTNEATYTPNHTSLDVTVHLPFGMRPGNWKCVSGVSDYNGRYVVRDMGALQIMRTPAGQPSAPKSLTFTPSNSLNTSGTLSWSAPDTLGNPDLTKYVTEYSTDGGQTWVALPNGVTSSTSLQVSNLKASTNYLFRVRGDNGATFGQDTTFMNLAYGTVELNTLAAYRPSAPQNLTVNSVTSSGALLAWAAPLDNGGASITDLPLEISRDGQTWTPVSPTGSLALGYTLSGLAPGTRYSVRVSAKNSAGQSEYLTGSFTTSVSAASKPRNLAISNLSYNTLSLAWGNPATNGGTAISDYNVQYSLDGENWTLIPHSALSSRAFNVNTLAVGKKYYFRVAAITSFGVGEYSDAVSATTLASAASAPTSLSVKASTTSVVLGWKAVSNSTATATSNYLVEYSKDGKSWTTVKKSVSANTSLTVTGLKSKTRYQFRVKAVNSAGISLASKILTVTTN